MSRQAPAAKIPDHLSLEDDDVQIHRFDGLGARLKKIEYLLNQLRNFCIAEPGVSSEKKVQIERAVTRFAAIASIEEARGYNRFFGSTAAARKNAAELLRDLHLIRKQLRRTYTSRTISKALQNQNEGYRSVATAWPERQAHIRTPCSTGDQNSTRTSSVTSQGSRFTSSSLRFVHSFLGIPATESAVNCNILIEEASQYVPPRFTERFDVLSETSSDSESLS
ncbi:hypothetical protein FRB96_009710 [Tulasnella sp. 330]|nr:hypothetical protein FRB96_009710 [Tulasnella sp. 330]KAG8867454.1 hypothetical protein FRB98_004197 [Tulasnella sp. 332]